MQAWAPHQSSVHDVSGFGKEVEVGAVAGKEGEKAKGKGKGRLVGKLRRVREST